MKYTLFAVAFLFSACAATWMDPIRKVSPSTYQITHTMYKFSPTKGVRSGVLTRAREKCTSLKKSYTTVREEMTPGGALSYTLTFQCNEQGTEF